MVVSKCAVCWTCRGLFTGANDSIMNEHRRLCSPRQLLIDHGMFEHFVCDKSDYMLFISLKNLLDKFLRNERFSAKLKSVLPDRVVENLLDLRVSGFPGTNIALKSKPDSDKCNGTDGIPSQVNEKGSQTNLDTILKEEVIPFYRKEYEGEPLKVVTDEQTALPRATESTSPTPSRDEALDKSSSLETEEELRLLRDSFKEEVAGIINYVCKLCSHNTTSAKQMLRHQRAHNDGNAFKCETCNYSTLWRREWNLHQQQKHVGEKFLCHVCAAELPTNAALVQHMVGSHPDPERGTQTQKHPLQCESCDYVAREPASLKEHMRKHTGDKIRCPHEGCHFRSPYLRSLKKHLREKHASEKTLHCELCGFQTRHKSSLTKHIIIVHKDIKPYKCSKCSFTALYPSEIIAHAKSKHLKQKRFACSKCPFKTSYPLAIQKHVARHNDPEGFGCLVCGAMLATRCKARNHMEREHGYRNFQLALKEPSWEKVNPSDYKIKDDQPPIDLTNCVVLNDRTNSTKKTDSKSKAKETEIKMEPNDTFGMPSEILRATALSDEHDVVRSSSLGHDPELLTRNRQTGKEGNPMLSATTADLGDNENSLSSLFDLMSDFPRPTTLNRCQSASTLMFASLSPHPVDRPLTPDFFTETPSVASFFPNFSSKNLESDALSMGAEQTFENTQAILPSTPSSIGLSVQHTHFRTRNLSSPILPNFLCSPQAGTVRSLNRVNLSPGLDQSNCMEVDAVFSHLNGCSAADSSSGSAFTTISQQFATEIQEAVASIPISEVPSPTADEANNVLQDTSPFSSRPNL